LEQSFEESLGGFGVTACLNQDIEHDTVLIDGAPEIVQLALDPDEHRIEVPFVAWFSWDQTEQRTAGYAMCSAGKESALSPSARQRGDAGLADLPSAAFQRRLLHWPAPTAGPGQGSRPLRWCIRLTGPGITGSGVQPAR
jgi:hypothetical protein